MYVCMYVCVYVCILKSEPTVLKRSDDDVWSIQLEEKTDDGENEEMRADDD